MNDKLVKLLSSLMPAPSADRPLSETCVPLFKIIVLKKDSAPFAERHTTEIKKTKCNDKKLAPKSRRNFAKWFSKLDKLILIKIQEIER